MSAEAERDNGEQQGLLASVRGTSDSTQPESAGPRTFKRTLGTLEAFAIIVSIVIGSGVFTSPGAIDTNVPSAGAALVVWVVGGVLAVGPLPVLLTSAMMMMHLPDLP